MRILVVGLAALALAGCATTYKERKGFASADGVSAVRFDETTLQVTSRVNAFTDADTVQQFLLRKTAEETLRAGYDLFYIVRSADRTQRSDVVLPGSYSSTTSFSGNSVRTNAFYSPARAFQLVAPGETAVVKMAKGRKAPGETNIYDAREILRYLATSIATDKEKGAPPSVFLANYPDDRPPYVEQAVEVAPVTPPGPVGRPTAPPRQAANPAPPPAQRCGMFPQPNGTMRLIPCR